MDTGRVPAGRVSDFLAAWVAVIVLVTLSGCSLNSSEPGIGVGPGSGTSPLTIYAEASCAHSGPHLVSLSELIGGSRTSFGVPIYWQIASRTGTARSVYKVGRRPPGFVTTVPFVEHLQTEPRFNPAAGRPTVRFYEVDVDGTSMGFTFGELRAGQVATNGQGYVPTSEYLRKAKGPCHTRSNSAGTWLLRLLASFGIGLFVVLVALATTRSRRKQILGTGLVVAAALVLVLTVLDEPGKADPSSPDLPRGRPEPGRLAPALKQGQRVLLVVDSTYAPGDSLTQSEFHATGRYVIYVGCRDTSLQVSEGIDRPDVSHGARTVAICNPSIAVPSGLDVTPKDSVFLGVIPNGVKRWRVTVATP